MDILRLSEEFRYGAEYCLRHWVGLPEDMIVKVIDDIIQSAWVRHLEKPGESPFYSGRLAAQNFVKRNGAFYKNTTALDDHIEYQTRTSREPLPQEISAALFEEFFKQRKPSGPRAGAENRTGGKRRLAAAARDTLIVDLLWQGYSDEGVAMEIGCTYYSLRTYRRQIKDRLRSIKNAQT